MELGLYQYDVVLSRSKL